MNLDWGTEQLSDYAIRLRHHPAVAVWFTNFPLTATDRTNMRGAVTQIKAQGGILLLTLQPAAGLGAVTDAAADDLAHGLADVNNGGVPVIIRFAHEMNGSWYAWGQQPRAYIAAFRRLAVAVHSYAHGSAMMWAPASSPPSLPAPTTVPGATTEPFRTSTPSTAANTASP